MLPKLMSPKASGLDAMMTFCAGTPSRITDASAQLAGVHLEFALDLRLALGAVEDRRDADRLAGDARREHHRAVAGDDAAPKPAA